MKMNRNNNNENNHFVVIGPSNTSEELLFFNKAINGWTDSYNACTKYKHKQIKKLLEQVSRNPFPGTEGIMEFTSSKEVKGFYPIETIYLLVK